MSERILDLDLGNTRLKWRYSLAGATITEGAAAHSQWRPGELLIDSKVLDRIRIATVVQGETLESLLTACRQHWRIEPEIARVTEHCAGVRQGYEDRSRLGADRWLALLAAYNSTDRGCVVVSCGTAVTVDLVTSAGEHLGGYIVPGVELMRTALFAGTSAVKLDRISAPEDLSPGRNTISAVSRGLLLMIRGLAETAGLELQRHGDLPGTIITGGDGELLLPFLIGSVESTKPIYRPNLVLDGLPLALP